MGMGSAPANRTPAASTKVRGDSAGCSLPGRYCDSWTDSEQSFDGCDVGEVDCDDIEDPDEYDDTDDIELEVARNAEGKIMVRRVDSEEPER